MTIHKISEGKVKISYPEDSRKKLDSKVPVFYNPVMQTNRDILVILLNSIDRHSKNPLRYLDLMSASGIRALRVKAEVKNVECTANDMSKTAVKNIISNAKLNNLKIKVEEKPANVLLSELNSYEFIDLDPFGTPVPFLDSAIRRISPHGFFAVTATDTSALCGTYEYACRRKYSSKPIRNEFMHESGIRILIRKVQEIAAQYEVALTPIFSHSSNHYMRVYFKKESGAKKANKILRQHGYVFYNWKNSETRISFDLSTKPEEFDYAGPMWLGELYDNKLVKKMLKFAEKNKKLFSKDTMQLLKEIESELETIFFYDSHILAKNTGISAPKLEDLFEKIRKSGKSASRTHFSKTGFKTTLEFEKLKLFFKK